MTTWSNEDGLLRPEAANSSLWPEATRLLKSQRAYSRPEAAIVACGWSPQGLPSHKSRLSPGQMVSLVKLDNEIIKCNLD